MKERKKFIMADLIKMSAEELKEIEDVLWEDWQRVSNARKVVEELEE